MCIAKTTYDSTTGSRDHETEITVQKKPANFEEMLAELGGFGKFQIFVTFLYLLLEIPCGFAIFIPIFVGRFPDEWTCDGEIVTKEDMCGCNGTLKGNLEQSIVAEWNLVCDQLWISDFITSVQMSGLFFGSLFGSQVADWYGRKYGFLLSIFMMGLGSSVSATASTPYIYAISRFISGAGIQAFINVTGAGVMEFMPPNFRSFANCIGPLGEGIMILSVMASYIMPWRTLYWATTLPLALVFLLLPFLPESPRWLLRQNRIKDAHSVLAYVARLNGREPIDIHVVEAIAKAENPPKDEEEQQPTYIDFFRDPALRLVSLKVMGVWFAWSLTYYGLSFNLKNLDGDIYTNVFIMGVANAVGQRLAIITNDTIGRTKSLFSFMAISAILTVAAATCYLTIGTSTSGLIGLILCSVGLLGMSGVRSISKVITGESFPTSLRSRSFGISGIAITAGGVLSPQLALLGFSWPAIPYFVLSVVSVLGSILSMTIRETKGMQLDAAPEQELSPVEAFDGKKGIHTSVPKIIIEEENEL